MGLNSQEVMELIQYIQENNSWNKLHTSHKKGRKTVKYYDMKFDTRTGSMWSITFRQVSGTDNRAEEVIFRTERDYNLKERIYNWLDEVREVKS